MKRSFNYILTILIVICLIILIYRFSWPTPGDGEDGFEPTLPETGIINIHEHIHKTPDVDKWLAAMDECKVSTTIMLGSPEATFVLSSEPGFNNHEKNNDVVIWLEKKYDSKILAFPTLDPRDSDNLRKFKDYMARGAIGLKLFSGHTGEIFPAPKETLYDYLGPLNRSEMYGVYEYCEKNRIPIIWHIKLQWDYLFNETRAVLKDFPNLIVNIPHFGVLGSNLTRLAQLMDTYPGVYTDISFGGFAYWSMKLASNHVEHYSEFVIKYQDRVMFGTDMVVTNNVRKTVPWIVNLTMAYRDMLEKNEFHVNVSNITGEGFPFDMTLNGFNLSQNILDKIYFDNPIRFLRGKTQDEDSGNSIFKTMVNDFETNITLVSFLILVPVTSSRLNSSLWQNIY
jgi:predicted TIM-barrel fold metal-dependent hydrolase